MTKPDWAIRHSFGIRASSFVIPPQRPYSNVCGCPVAEITLCQSRLSGAPYRRALIAIAMGTCMNMCHKPMIMSVLPAIAA